MSPRARWNAASRTAPPGSRPRPCGTSGADGWSPFQVEIRKAERAAGRPDVAVGVDLGLKCLAALAGSHGEVRYVPNPAHYDTALKILKRMSRRFPPPRTRPAHWTEAVQGVADRLPLHVRVFHCDACGLVVDRDENAAVDLAALAVAGTTGTGVAGDPDAQASEPRGADQKTRAGRASRKAGPVRAGGAIPPRRAEARDRHQDTTALALW